MFKQWITMLIFALILSFVVGQQTIICKQIEETKELWCEDGHIYKTHFVKESYEFLPIRSDPYAWIY
jgi:hypothetical protein